MGLHADLPVRDALGIWPENELPLRVFCRLCNTQWLVAPNGVRIGLRYDALPLAMDLERVPRRDRADVVDAVQDMESEALRLWWERKR